VPESALVRDVIFVCQGINGRYIRFDAGADGYVIDGSVGVPRAPRALVQRLVEAGWLFRRLRAALDLPGAGSHAAASASAVEEDGRGAVARAFAAAVASELSEYYRLIAMLEAQAQVPLPGPLSASSSDSAPYLTLRRLNAWLAEPLARLRLLALMVDAGKGLSGGALASALHAHAAHGDPGACALVGALLRAACAPLFDALVAWVTRGEVDTSNGDEFFVVADASVPEEHLWRRCYALRPGALPPFVTPAQAATALRIGKSINFLRRCCGDDAWAADAPGVLAAAAAAGGLSYSNPAALEALLRAGAAAVDARVRDALFTRFRLGDHCAAIKRYLLLGQGDFITSLMDAVGPALSERAAAVSSYKLMGVLEAAIRASNAQFDDPDILGRLRIRLMPHTGGESGWDVFSLEYVVTPPLTTLLTDEALGKYLRVFNFLWRLKRVEHALNGTWAAMKPSASLSLAPRARARRAAEAPPPLAAELRRCHMLRAEMAHFVTNLQYYIMFEVLEHSWAQFTDEMAAAADLDGLIGAHERYLEAIVAKALLGERSSLLAQQLTTLFELMLRFRGLADRVFDAARDAAASASLAALASHIGEGGGAAAAAASAAADLAPDAAAQLDILQGDYSTLLEGFLNLLPVQRHVDLRSLLFRLDFSEFYSVQHDTTFTTPLPPSRGGGARNSMPGTAVLLQFPGARTGGAR
jgi:gamma-tubulin complex component 3